MTVDDIRNVTFDKAMRGYRMEEVDTFLAQAAAEFEKLEQDKEDLEKKLYILAEKVDQYRNDEDTLKTALLNAQRMGESVIYEARQKAETIIYDANTKASQAKDEAAQAVADSELQLAQIKAEVAHFKASVLDLYRQHIEALSAIPGEERAARAEAPASTVKPAAAKKPAQAQKKAEAVPAAAEKPAEPERKATPQAVAFDFENDGYEEDEEYDAVPAGAMLEPTPFDEPEEKPVRKSAGRKKQKMDSFGDYEDIDFDFDD